jgi:hypothetical protein
VRDAALRSARRAIVFTGALVAVHAGGAHGLDALGVADRLSAGAVALLAAFLVVRLLLYFVAPGWLLATLLFALRDARAAGPGSCSGERSR